MATRIFLIRHGDTGKRWGVFVGSSDIGLVPGALVKARELGKSLKDEGIEAIYTSDLKRAWKTADAIGEALGIRPVRMKELNEIDFGEWELMWKGDVMKRYPEEWERRKKDKLSFRYPGGEKAEEFCERAVGLLKRLMKRHEGETIAFVIHGAFIKIVYSTFMGVDITKTSDMNVDFLGGILFKKDGDKIEIEREWGIK
jgi:broad specificity phosphatase PhoE